MVDARLALGESFLRNPIYENPSGFWRTGLRKLELWGVVKNKGC
jgi:hypothetical protein